MRGMALLDSLMALLALSIGLVPGTVLLSQSHRALAENAYHSRMLWHASNLVEALLLVEPRDHSALTQLAQQPRQQGECGSLSFKLSTPSHRGREIDSLRLQATGCHTYWYRFDLLVPQP